ncbi:Protein kinase domain-containing protein [Mycena indigotica]|uniref:Protein kinase domain-containing protein n=1 Tax=Mycena indigotica TaxID=2126181 RepID=A0A8H6W6M9_9AGAR|nr:Protein kinase domain-containing protein [Mycena indigotica]KAF7301254.1 Protein kinase domain-containing protein [Mycena indigotica]
MSGFRLHRRTHEIYWFERRTFLEAAGYRLRPKFDPEYIPNAGWWAMREYSAIHFKSSIMDAHRIVDNKPVMFKTVRSSVHPDEVEIALMFSSPPLAANPRNHCIPILDVLQDPEDAQKQILVMPRFIEFSVPKFDTVGEVVDCFRQIFEGIGFMHENFVAHRDCCYFNIVQDPTLLFPAGYHPIHTWQDPEARNRANHITRTECWPRYYLIDFGLSKKYNPADGPPLEDIILAGDKSPPEHKTHFACNPFPTDIYFLGNLLKEDFLFPPEESKKACFPNLRHSIRPSLRFLEPLVKEMTLPDPSMRPTIGEVRRRFDELCSELSEWQLRRPGQRHSFGPLQLIRQLTRTLLRVHPLPRRTPALSDSGSLELSKTMRDFYTQTQLEKINNG